MSYILILWLSCNWLFVLQGGGDGDNNEDAIQLYQEDGWTTVGHMNVPRHGHAVSTVNFEDFC